MIHVYQSLSGAGGRANEDLIRYDRSMLMLLDGSTSLLPSRLDARWFTRCFAQGLFSAPDGSLPSRINRALEYARTCYLSEQTDADADLLPSAAGIFVQERGETLETMAVGDCTGLFFLRSGDVVTVSDDAVGRFDAEVLAFCRAKKAETGQTFAQLMKTDEVRRRLVENRRRMNRPDGYRILSPAMSPCAEDALVTLPAAQVERIVLHSDGFDAMCAELRRPDASLPALYARLRATEAADPEFEITPRFKSGDDASALFAELSPC